MRLFAEIELNNLRAGGSACPSPPGRRGPCAGNEGGGGGSKVPKGFPTSIGRRIRWDEEKGAYFNTVTRKEVPLDDIKKKYPGIEHTVERLDDVRQRVALSTGGPPKGLHEVYDGPDGTYRWVKERGGYVKDGGADVFDKQGKNIGPPVRHFPFGVPASFKPKN